MRKPVLFIVSVFFLCSCALEDTFPHVENITSGKKWTLEIGSSPLEVYEQLQELSEEKKFYSVSTVFRKPFSRPEEIQSDLRLYNAITLERTYGVTKRALIEFDGEKVKSIQKGGALYDPIPMWPEDAPDEATIHINDPISEIPEKLLAIYQIPEFQSYQMILPDKPLDRPYDPEMENYNEWAFSFSEDINSGKVGRHSVRLYFKNKELIKIGVKYTENEMVN